MAKSKASVDKREKKQGNTFIIKANYSIPGRIAILPPGTELRECEDGYYTVYIGGERLGFRVGEKIINDNKENLTHA